MLEDSQQGVVAAIGSALVDILMYEDDDFQLNTSLMVYKLFQNLFGRLVFHFFVFDFFVAIDGQVVVVVDDFLYGYEEGFFCS